MRNSIFTDSEQWAEFSEIEGRAERLDTSVRLLMESAPLEVGTVEVALLAVATRLEALTYVVARIGGGDE